MTAGTSHPPTKPTHTHPPSTIQQSALPTRTEWSLQWVSPLAPPPRSLSLSSPSWSLPGGSWGKWVGGWLSILSLPFKPSFYLTHLRLSSFSFTHPPTHLLQASHDPEFHARGAHLAHHVHHHHHSRAQVRPPTHPPTHLPTKPKSAHLNHPPTHPSSGKTNWIQGSLLITCYIFISFAVWHETDTAASVDGTRRRLATAGAWEGL